MCPIAAVVWVAFLLVPRSNSREERLVALWRSSLRRPGRFFVVFFPVAFRARFLGGRVAVQPCPLGSV